MGGGAKNLTTLGVNNPLTYGNSFTTGDYNIEKQLVVFLLGVVLSFKFGVSGNACGTSDASFLYGVMWSRRHVFCASDVLHAILMAFLWFQATCGSTSVW